MDSLIFFSFPPCDLQNGESKILSVLVGNSLSIHLSIQRGQLLQKPHWS